MLKITLVGVGKLKESHWQEAAAEFQKRLAPHAKLEVIEVAPSPAGATVTREQSMRTEAARILTRLPQDAFVVALERTGREPSSLELAELMRREGGSGRALCVVIGGTEGLDLSVLDRADYTMSMSRLTLTHEMARVLALEQLYRGCMIIAGREYHR